QEPSFRSVLSKIRHETILVHDLLDKLESEIQHQEKLNNLLKELQKSTEIAQKEAQHLSENIPPHLLKAAPRCTSEPTVKCAEQAKVAEPKPAKKPTKETRFVKNAPLLTVEEFESIPAYMRGRITYDQINVVIKGINQAVARKYKILHQPLKSMSAPVRNLYDRFLEQETKDTKGIYFFFFFPLLVPNS
ncbi:PREDICTED: spindle and kinetochore-associated protein 1-like, partial [Apaloderma vittatum]|uniref:spindle and kinetochore-associated protein 1-like n=1 Tax=Apaloderma vittatum TaxID=57397 RepID=UPI0005212122